MKRFGLLTLAAIALAACSDMTAPAAPELAPFQPAVGPQALQGSYIVVLKDDADPRMVLSQSDFPVRFVYQSSIRGFAGELTNAQLNQIRSHPDVAYVETDRVVQFAPPCGTPAGGPCDGDGDDGDTGGQVTPQGITRVGGPVDGTGLTAWVIDTGIDLDHPDLIVDATRSANFVTRGKDSPDDGNGHGTHVAGTIAAVDNDIDVVGVAAGATLVAVRVLDNSGSGTISGVIAGVDYVGGNAAAGDAANMSLGGGASQSLDDAVIAASSNGIWFSLAAGNSSEDASNTSPARANGDFIRTISAIDSNDCFASFSNFGNPPVDYAEPGVSILSTARGGGTTTLSGTSMAAPHAAGLLLFGEPSSGGTADCDPDGNPDTIGVF